VATRLGVAAPGAYDLNAACAGFCYALATASDAVRAGTSRYALVIGAEKLSQWVDWTDRSTCIIFADGAGAAVVGPVTDPQAGPGIGPVVWGSDGNMADKIFIKDRNSFLMQEGQAVFRWATTALHPVARKACELAGVDPSRAGRVRPAPGEPADRGGHRPQARGPPGTGRRRHRARRQHIVRVDPAGPVPHDRSAVRSAPAKPFCCWVSGRASATPPVITVP
jgi:hypothetical protein